MQYFDFVMSEEYGLRIKKLMDAKGQGRKVIGSYCVIVPEDPKMDVNALCMIK